MECKISKAITEHDRYNGLCKLVSHLATHYKLFPISKLVEITGLPASELYECINHGINTIGADYCQKGGRCLNCLMQKQSLCDGFMMPCNEKRASNKN